MAFIALCLGSSSLSATAQSVDAVADVVTRASSVDRHVAAFPQPHAVRPTHVLAPEGPFGDHTCYYTPNEPFPLLHVTFITHRRDPDTPSLDGLVPPTDAHRLGNAT